MDGRTSVDGVDQGSVFQKVGGNGLVDPKREKRCRAVDPRFSSVLLEEPETRNWEAVRCHFLVSFLVLFMAHEGWGPVLVSLTSSSWGF